MPARAEEWHLLGLDKDPVPSAPSDIDPVIAHYRKVTTALEDQAVLMRRLGDGDDAGLKGEYVDAMRKRAKESAETLGKAAGRYRNVRDALDEYRGALEIARSESQKAVDAATEAASERASAENSADPAGNPREEGAPEPSAEDLRVSEDRADAIGRASGALDAARESMRRAQVAFDLAADAASARIRKDWDVDGLSNTLASEIRHGAVIVLKAIVEVLGYIGMALAVIGLLFTGVGWFLIAGAVIAAVSLVASLTLSIMGEANWLNVILGVVGLFTLGLGMWASKIAANTAKVAKATGNAKVKAGVTEITGNLSKIKAENWLGALGGIGGRVGSAPIGGVIARPVISRLNTVPAGGIGRAPVPRPTGGPTFTPAPVRIDTVSNLRVTGLQSYVDVLVKLGPSSWATRWVPNVKGLGHIRNWNPAAALGIDDAVAAAALSAKVWNLFGTGSPSISKWLYFGVVANGYGFASGIFGAAHAPSDLAEIAGAEDYRTEWGLTEWLEEKLMSEDPHHDAFDFPPTAVNA